MFGEILKDLRKTKNLTQSDIAKMFDVKDATVSAWECGKAQPSIEIITQLATYFGVTTDCLLGFNKDDINDIERLKIALKEAGMMVGEDLTKEELEKALQIVAMLKDTKNTN